ncbi:MAG: hypothetical protein JXR97_07005 [Planctomycetes bacterium]|nr:hypothetical protein [Planctomycetota bacterium]
MDDASRDLCHGEFFFADDTDSLIQASLCKKVRQEESKENSLAKNENSD